MFINLGHWQYNSVVPEDAQAFVYEIINKVNGRQYVGCKTMTGRDGWAFYKSSSKMVKKEIKKFGKDNFEFIILKFFVNKDDASEYERETMIMNNVLRDKNYYNQNIAGKILLKHTDETKAIIAERMKGNRINVGRKRSEEFSKAIADRKRGKPRSTETKEKISNSLIGSTHTEETKRKISEHNKANNKIPPSAKGLKRSEETKRRMSESIKAASRRKIENMSEEELKEYKTRLRQIAIKGAETRRGESNVSVSE